MGGVEYTTLRVAQALDKSKFDPVIICPEEGDLPSLARQAGLNVHIVPRPKFFSVSFFWGNRYIANPLGFIFTAINVFYAVGILRKYLQSNPAELIITKGLLAHFYGGLAANWQKIPCIWYVQEEVDAKRAGGLFRWLLQQGAQHLAKKVLVDAQALVDQFGNSLPHDCIQVIYNGVDINEFTPFTPQMKQDARTRLGIPANAVVIGQAGRLVPLKGQKILLQAFNSIFRKFPDAHLLLVGAPLFGDDAYQQALKVFIDENGLSERVIFTGFLPEVREGLAAMDIFVNASLETDSPVAVMEAMASGLATIVSAVDGTIEMVTPEMDALVFPSGNKDALAEILTLLLSSPLRMNELRTHARQSAVQKFSLSASVAKIQSSLEQVFAS